MPEVKKNIRHWLQSIDWKLLLFLLLFLNVKMVIKIIALVLIYILRPNFRFGFGLKKNARLPLFYILVIAIALLNWVLAGHFSDTNYTIALLTGISFWILCILAAHQVKLSVDENPVQTIQNTLLLFFICNAVFSLLTLIFIIRETGAVNPYMYQGMHQKYFIGTGDAIKGITFDTSAANAIINSFGVIYSLKKSKFVITLLCMAAMLLTASNITTLLLLAALIFVFAFQSDRNQKSIVIVCSFMLLIFLTKVSPQNGIYITRYFPKNTAALMAPPTAANHKISVLEKPDSQLSVNEKRQKTAMLYLDSLYKARLLSERAQIAEVELPDEHPLAKPSIPKANIHTEPYQKNKDTTLIQKKLLEFAADKTVSFDTSQQDVKQRTQPGKIAAFQQTIYFLEQHPSKIFAGTGMGNFSSKLAFRVTGLGIAGGYPQRFLYLNDDFRDNHLRLYLDYFSKELELHSLMNTPNSVYDQLLAEYGIAGILSFLFFYLGFFLKRPGRLTYGVPLLILLVGCLGTEYWFEQLSIIPVFELLLFLNLKETKEL